MMYYLASLAIGEDGTITAIYREPSFTPLAGPPHHQTLASAIRLIPTVLEPTLRGGRSASTQGAQAAGRTAGKSE